MNRRYWRSMTTVFCIRVDTTTPSRVCPRTDSRPWNGHFGSVHGFSGIGTSIPTSRTVESTGFGAEAGVAGFFCAFFSALSIHRAFFTRSSGRTPISSPYTSKPTRADLPRVRRRATHRGHASLVHQLVPKLRELLRDRLRVHRADLLRPEQWHYVSSPPPVSTSTSTPSSLTCFATFLSRFAATLLFLTFFAGSASSGTIRGSGSSTDSPSIPGPTTAATSTIGSGGAIRSASAAAAAAARNP